MDVEVEVMVVTVKVIIAQQCKEVLKLSGKILKKCIIKWNLQSYRELGEGKCRF